MDSNYVTGHLYILHNAAYGEDGVKVIYQGNSLNSGRREHIFFTQENGDEISVPMDSIIEDIYYLEDNRNLWFIEEDTTPNSNMNAAPILTQDRRKRKSRKSKAKKSRKAKSLKAKKSRK